MKTCNFNNVQQGNWIEWVRRWVSPQHCGAVKTFESCIAAVMAAQCGRWSDAKKWHWWCFQSEMPGRSVGTGSQDFSVGECQSQQGRVLIGYPTSLISCPEGLKHKTTLQAKTFVTHCKWDYLLTEFKLQRQSRFSAIGVKVQHQTKPFIVFRRKTAVLSECISDYFGKSIMFTIVVQWPSNFIDVGVALSEWIPC